jgi:hypothetical protein
MRSSRGRRDAHLVAAATHRRGLAAHENRVGLEAPGVGNWRGGWGALGARREYSEYTPGDVRRGRSVLAMMILEGMNCLDG